VLAAGIVLIAGGALSVISSVRAFGSELGGLEVINVILSALVGLALIYAGTQVMARLEQGRILGLGLSAVGAIFALLALIQGFTPAIVSLLLNGFVIYALTQTGESFRR
jgi:hypothetical protein